MTNDLVAARRREPLPVGFHALHPDVGINFQLNRFYSWVGRPEMVDEMRAAVRGIADYPAFVEAFLALSSQRLHDGDTLEGAAYLRIAEFFLPTGDARKEPARQRFIELVGQYYGISDSERFAVPYASTELPAYRFTPDSPRGTVVVFGGYDSYIEEWFRAAFALEAAGYDVVLFEGPGQGTALERTGLPLTAEWHKPVAAVLDHFGLDGVTLLGFSLGGGLVLRAAAYEERVTRVVCNGIVTDLLDVVLRSFPEQERTRLRARLSAGDADSLNSSVAEAMDSSLLLRWAMAQGEHVMGQRSAFDVFKAFARFETASVSPLVHQDVLLLHGNGDHLIPGRQLLDQIDMLGNARSVSTRIFTEYEQAQSHCQVGNFGLAVREITAWLGVLDERDAVLRAREAAGMSAA